jgi:hypothetical protein
VSAEESKLVVRRYVEEGLIGGDLTAANRALHQPKPQQETGHHDRRQANTGAPQPGAGAHRAFHADRGDQPIGKKGDPQSGQDLTIRRHSDMHRGYAIFLEDHTIPQPLGIQG